METNHLTKRYGRTAAVHDLTMAVPRGAVYGLVGRNGAGKTTLFRLLCGLQRPSDGGFSICGVPHSDRSISRARRRMGAVVEMPSIYLDFSARDNLRMQYRVLGLPEDGSIGELLRLVGLSETGEKRARNFSLGMRQRLGIAVALAGGPDLLLLDEPTNGLDPEGIIEMRELILKLNREKGITLLISSHILDELAKVSTHYGFLEHGSLVREMSAETLRAASSKRLAVTVSDTAALARALDSLGVRYEITGKNGADIFGEIGLSRLAEAAKREGAEIFSAENRSETLEGYFMDLLGGGGNA